MFKPMLAGKVLDPQQLEFPLLASPKLDGVRCLIRDGKAMSRNMKPIPNEAVQGMLGGLPAFDGEIICGPPTAKSVFQDTMSGVTSREGIPHFKYYVFDVTLNKPLPFNERYNLAKDWAAACSKFVQVVPHKLIKTAESLLAYEGEMLLAGCEGVMVRSLDGPYKQGRSTWNEGYLLKLKRFEDSEAVVIGYGERMHNANELKKDELGRAKRSSAKAGKEGTDTLGFLSVRDIESGIEFDLGTGFDDSQRAELWTSRESLEGRQLTYTFQPTGVKDKPRFPVFKGWRGD